MKRLSTLIYVLAAALAAPAQALLIRPDRDDEEYRELATRYPATASFEGRDGAGVLIAPQWVLTTARRARDLADAKPAARVLVGGKAHEIGKAILHPAWSGGAEADIALLLLREASATEPAALQRQSGTAGQAVRIVAAGPTGRMGEKPAARGGAPVLRASVNTVERLLPALFEVRLKPADDASDLQGALTAAETGAPAFVESEGRILVAGLAQSLEDSNGDGIAGNAGDREYFVRVSAYAAWIDEAMGKAALEEAARAVGAPANPRR